MSILPKGYHVTVSWGLKPGGGWQHTEFKRCQLCKAPEVHIEKDDDVRRVMVCDNCGGIEVISKGATWWYHDAQLPANMAPRWLQLLATGERA